MKRKNFTLIEIMIVVAIIGLLAAIAIPQFMKYLNDSRKNACISNLKQIDTAVHAYCGANNTETIPAMSSLIVSGDAANSYLKVTPTCPSGGTYSMPASLTENPTCSKSANGHVMP